VHSAAKSLARAARENRTERTERMATAPVTLTAEQVPALTLEAAGSISSMSQMSATET
jgi:hypothetical protein